jgi:phospholipid/cholesterol/gamma-HCH transport system substrate-binding protein
MTQETRLGMFVLLGIGALVISILLLGNFQLQRTYKLHILFSDIAGLPNKAKVKIAGVEVGAVKDITLDGNQAKVTVWIRQGVAIHRDTRASVVATGIIGSKYLELTIGTPAEALLRDGDTVVGLDPVSIEKIISNVMKQVDSLAESLQGNGRRSVGENLSVTMENLRLISTSLRESLVDHEDRVGRIVKNIDQFTADVADITADNKADIRAAIRDVRSISERLNTMIAKVEQGQGTIGKLINDPEMGDNLKTAVQETKETVHQANKALRRLSQIETYWEYRLRQDAKQDVFRSDVGLKIVPRPGKFYYVGGTNLGSGDTNPSDPEEKNTIDLLLGREFGPVAIYGGAMRSCSGVGVKVKPLWKWDPWRRLEMTAEAYHFSRRTPVRRPKVNAGAKVAITKWGYLGAQFEDLYADTSLNTYLNLSFKDEDIGYMLGLIGLAKP